MQYSEYQIGNLLQLLMTPAGIAAIFVLLAIGAAVIIWVDLKWFVIAFLLYASTFGYTALVRGDLAFPLNMLRAYGRSICAAGLIMLILPALFSGAGWRSRLVLPGAVAYFVYQIIASLRQGFGGDVSRSGLLIVSFGLIFVALHVGIGQWLQTPREAVQAVRAISLGGALFTLGIVYQYIINKGVIAWAGRLFGTSGNANHCAVALATCLPATCYLLMRPGGKFRRVLMAVGAGLMIVMLMWTGSRTGFATAVVAMVVLFRFRVVKLMGVGIVVTVVTLLLLQVFTGASDMASRLISTDNNRSFAWISMWGNFVHSPLIGLHTTDLDSGEFLLTENSYLLVLARTGLLGGIPFYIGVVSIARSLIQLHAMRRWLGEYKMLADLCTAGIISLGVGALFEGYLYAVYSMPVLVIYIYLGIIAFLLDFAAANRANASLEAEQFGSHEETEAFAAAQY